MSPTKRTELLGIDMITIGTAVTMPGKITSKFANAMKIADLSEVDFANN